LRATLKIDGCPDHALDHQQPYRAWNFLKARRQSTVVAQTGAVKFLGPKLHPNPGIFFMLFDVLDVAGEAEKL
jgi:hypothetical protein